MNEKLLQYIWKNQYFNKQSLCTEQGEPIQIVFPGNFNTEEGPDFTEAVIIIGEHKWIGSVEIHIAATDWHQHQHQKNKQYNNVILHVVWRNNAAATNEAQQVLPVLVLANRVSGMLLNHYEQLMQSPATIPCTAYVSNTLSEIAWLKWKETLVAERLQRKAQKVLALFSEANSHWEQCFWWFLAANFGMKQNKLLFEAVAKSIDIKILARHKQQLIQLEALLLGQAHLLPADNNHSDSYITLLQKEYAFLKTKYQLAVVPFLPNHLRMRPGNFPAIRLAQLAKLIQQSVHLFSAIKEKPDYHHLINLFNVTANDYWHYHYQPLKESNYQPKKLGADAINHLLINVIAPALFAYAQYHQLEELKQQCIHLLMDIPAENNRITKQWQALQLKSKSAFDSQAFTELQTHYCDAKGCLQCAVGFAFLRRDNEQFKS